MHPQLGLLSPAVLTEVLLSSIWPPVGHPLCFSLQVDAMKVGAKEMKKAYKNIKIDKIEVSVFDSYSKIKAWVPFSSSP